MFQTTNQMMSSHDVPREHLPSPSKTQIWTPQIRAPQMVYVWDNDP